MQKSVEHTRTNGRVSLLIRERSRGKSLRRLGQMFGRSHEKIRQILIKYGPPQVTLRSEDKVAAKLGYPAHWVAQLREKGLLNPIRPGSRWLYSEEQVRQIPALITDARKCQRCGKPRPLGSLKFCTKCQQYWRKHRSEFLSPKRGQGREKGGRE